MQSPNRRSKAFYQSLPKVDLHRHLEGSIRLSTLLELAKIHKLDLPTSNPNLLRRMVQVQKDDPFTFRNFLSKFETLRLFYLSREVIQRITLEAIEDAARDNVRYMELRFTPVALSKVKNYPLGEVIDWVTDSVGRAEKQYGVTTRLIASVNRHESLQIAEQVIELAIDRMDDGIVGLDLAGDEANFSGKSFAGIFKEAKEAGLKLTIHAGEWGVADHIIEAIEIFDADRIGHGVRVLENPDAFLLAKEREIIFEVCPTSNYQSGVVQSLEDHPLPKMVKGGLKVTINTDDPGISDIDLSDEYFLACESFSLSLDELWDTTLNAARGAFLKDGENEALEGELMKEFAN